MDPQYSSWIWSDQIHDRQALLTVCSRPCALRWERVFARLLTPLPVSNTLKQSRWIWQIHPRPRGKTIRNLYSPLLQRTIKVLHIALPHLTLLSTSIVLALICLLFSICFLPRRMLNLQLICILLLLQLLLFLILSLKSPIMPIQHALMGERDQWMPFPYHFFIGMSQYMVFEEKCVPRPQLQNST